MTVGFRHIENWDDYSFGCPDGAWSGRLDNKAWGKQRNLILYISDIATGEKFWFSVFHANGYRPRDEGLELGKVPVGTLLQLTTGKNKNGNPVVLTAAVVSDAGQAS